MPITEPRTRRWTRDEYYRMGDLGFFDGQRVQLVNGRVIRMPAMNNAHVSGVSLTLDALQAAFGKGFWVRVQAPLALARDSEPEPDLAVVPGSVRDYKDHPTTALLVVEVSDTTLAFDRRVKCELYARAGIKDYWILNLVHRELEVYRDPKPNPAKPDRFMFAQVTTLGAADSVRPLALPKTKIAVDDLLP